MNTIAVSDSWRLDFWPKNTVLIRGWSLLKLNCHHLNCQGHAIHKKKATLLGIYSKILDSRQNVATYMYCCQIKIGFFIFPSQNNCKRLYQPRSAVRRFIWELKLSWDRLYVSHWLSFTWPPTPLSADMSGKINILSPEAEFLRT